MQTEAIEAALARLMPPALSEDCQFEIEEMIDELAGSEAENVVAISSGKWIARSLIGGGIAASIGALCAVFPMMRGASDPRLVQTPPANSAQGFVLVSESDRIESVTDDGWREDSEGAAMHSVRLKAVQENNVRDQQTGMVVRISEPREEILMMPVSDFSGTPVLKKPSTSGMVEAASVPATGNGPLRVVNVAGKSASFSSADEGSALVSRDGGVYKVKITGLKDEVVFEGALANDNKLEQVPEIWRHRILVLCRTLDQALDGNMMPQRQPQPRIAPPAAVKP
ncbi:MAG: hypothetical protein ABIT37_19390 [Luteolibacter sp.]